MTRVSKPYEHPKGHLSATDLLRVLASGKNPDGTDYERSTEWSAQADATAALATATRAAEADSSHYVTAIEASYGSGQIGTLTVRAGATVLFTQAVHNQREIAFHTPLKLPAGTSAVAELSAGSVGVVGRVSLHGYTG